MLDRKLAVYGPGAGLVAHYMSTSFGFSGCAIIRAYTTLIADYLGFTPVFPLCVLGVYYPDMDNLINKSGCSEEEFTYSYKMLYSAMDKADVLINALDEYLLNWNPYISCVAYGGMISAEKQYFLDKGFELVSAGPVRLSDKHVLTDKDHSHIMAQLLCLDVFKPE